MPRVISSSITFFYKFVFPTVWIGTFAVATCAILVNALLASDAKLRDEAQLLCIPAIIATLAGGAFMYEGCVPLKRVVIDGDYLLISNYVTELAVPLSDIDKVEDTFWISIHPVTIILCRDTPLGRKIMFMPEPSWSIPSQTHPIVTELRELAAQAKSLGLESSRAA